MRKALLEGMLGANLVTFQSPVYQKHFLSTCSSLLVLEATTTEGVQLDDHFVNVISLAIGIDPHGFADVLMVTSLREGMNLTCHEFIICQDGSHCSKKFSEFTSSASLFKDSMIGHFDLSINPWDYQQTAKVIKSALEMDKAEKEYRYKKMHHVVVNHTGEYWVNNLNQSLAKHHGRIQSVTGNNRF